MTAHFTGYYPSGSIILMRWPRGFKRSKFRSAPDPKKPRAEEVFSLKPKDPPECGFVVRPHMIFNVTGDSGAIYIGSLLIDMDIKKKDGVGSIEAIKINHIEIKNEYAEAVELLKSWFSPSTLAIEKTLMTSTLDPVSAANGDCPMRISASREDVLRFLSIFSFTPSGGFNFPH